ncbi:DUF1367 family protein, partial [Salmonella enterica subsp. enterica]|nr:DUF1367 family protein [Salmonella enterica subsp. enterica serovar Poano]
YFYPDGSRGHRAKSIAFASIDETEFQQVYKAVLNVLWNWILFRKYSSPEEVENVVALCPECHHEIDNGSHLEKENRRRLMDKAIVLTVIELARRGLITPAVMKG